LIDLRRWLGVPAEQPPLLTVVLLQAGETRFGLVVDQVRGREEVVIKPLPRDQVRGREEVVIKPLPRALRGLPGYAGATRSSDH
ncbi:chemotaxis protein CheW, partial [Xanthomonas perforans]|uniref:chemotaxis protein CheW n=1 Tax=Xanthomonas perforans TaxID=442694 RepID=UPI00119271A2